MISSPASGRAALVFLVLVLGLVNFSIFSKEKHLSEGAIVYIVLAPVDPRSLMQGDYMALRFALAIDVYEALPKTADSLVWRQQVEASDGHVVVNLDEKNIASFSHLDQQKALSDGQMRLRYRVRNGSVNFATNAFFFQEGHAEYYEPARYGQFRVDSEGELLLVAMYDEHLNKLSAPVL